MTIDPEQDDSHPEVAPYACPERYAAACMALEAIEKMLALVEGRDELSRVRASLLRARDEARLAVQGFQPAGEALPPS